MPAATYLRRRRFTEGALLRSARNFRTRLGAASWRPRAPRVRTACILAFLLWLFCDVDSYPLWMLWWGRTGPSPVDPKLTHNCVSPNYDRPLAVVVPLIASQVSRLRVSMNMWGTAEGLPCTNLDAVGSRPHLLFYFDRPLDEPIVVGAVGKIRQFTAENNALRTALQRCFANVSFSSASLSASDTQNSRRFDVLRNLASSRGSNNQFWNAFAVHAPYRHMLYMEPDTWPLKPNWLPAVDSISRDHGFWMRGTLMRYQPRFVVAPEPYRSAYTRHINGNAIYDLQDPCFAHYRTLVHAAYGDAAFDVAMSLYRTPRYRYILEHSLAHRFAATNVIADMGIEGFANIEEMRLKLPGTYLAHAKFNFVTDRSFGIIQH